MIPVAKFIQEKKDYSQISELRLITRSKKKINFEEELFTVVLEEASISKEDSIGMFINDQKYTTSKIIRKWNNLFRNKVDISEIFSRFSNIGKNSNLFEMQLHIRVLLEKSVSPNEAKVYTARYISNFDT